MTKREPFKALLASVWDCLTNPLTITGGLAIRERLNDVREVITAWIKGN